MLPRFPNGRIPAEFLYRLDTGDGRHLLTYATAIRWYGFRADVAAETGVTLYISPGMNGYRDYAEQQVGRSNACASGNCAAAASAGTSSHGGTMNYSFTGWQTVDAMAIDVGNYWAIPWETFKRIAARWGFQAGLITRAIAGIEEPWHLIDPDPYGTPPAGLKLTQGADGVWRLAPTTDHALLRRQKEDTMYVKGTSYASVYAVFTDANGKPALRACGAAEQSYALTAGIVTTGYDSTLTSLANECGYGRPIVPEVAHAGLSVIKIQAPGIETTYALWGPSYWDETTDPELANSWARVYGNAENLTFAQWEDRKKIGQGGKS